MLKRLSDDLLNSIKQPTEYAKRLRVSDTLVSNFFALVATRSISFYVTVTQNGKRKAVNLGRFPIVSVEAARLRAIELITGNNHTSFESYNEVGAATGETLTTLLNEYAKSRDFAANTLRDMLQRTPRILGDMANIPISNITAESFADWYANELKTRATSAKMAVRWVRAALRWKDYTDLTSRCTKHTGTSPNVAGVRDKRLEVEQLKEFRAVLTKCTHSQRLAIYTAICTGLRRNELRQITTHSLDQVNRTILINQTKNGKQQTLPIGVMLWDMLTSASKQGANGERLFHVEDKTPKSIRSQFGISWHDLRRSCGSLLAELGAPLHVIQRVLNHSAASASVTEKHYLHLSNDSIREWLGKLEQLIMLG